MESATKQNCDKGYSASTDNEKQVLNDVISSIVKKEGFKNYKVDTKFHSLLEQGFLGSTCEVNIKGIKENYEHETNLFIKIMSPNISTLIVVPEVYAKEIFVYRDLANIYDDLENEFNVPEEERYKIVKSYPDFPPSVIVLENMSQKGYRTEHRSKIVSLEYAEQAVKKLAKFHALSFVLKEKKPKYFEQNIVTLKHSFTFSDEWSNFIHNFLGIAMEYVKDDIKKKLELLKMVFTEKYKMHLEDEKYKICLCHGDYRPSNILIKETNGQITELIPIDYQLVYYGCPVLDLIYFIFASLDQKMRRNIPHIKDTYYKTLESYLAYFDIKAGDVFSKTEFEDMYHKRLDYGLLVSLLMMPILMAPDDNLTDLETMTHTQHNTDKDCQERMIGIINDFIEWGYL